MRDLTRGRTALVSERARAVNRLQQGLEDANLKLASVATDVLGTSARAMLEDVLQAIAGVRPRQAVAIVTGDSWAEQAARSLGFEIISDPSNESETAAIQMATAVCASRGEDSTLVIPGDIPLIQRGEIEQVLAAAPAEGMVLVPAWDGRGTNAVLRRPNTRSE